MILKSESRQINGPKHFFGAYKIQFTSHFWHQKFLKQNFLKYNKNKEKLVRKWTMMARVMGSKMSI